MLGFGQYQRQNQQLKILPQQIQFLNLLQLSTSDLEHHLQKELEENPFLESKTVEVSLDDAPTATNDNLGADYDDPTNWGGMDDDVPDYRMRTESGYEAADDSRQFQTADRSTWRDDLKIQAKELLGIEPTQLQQIEFLIDSLEEDGMLKRSPAILADDLSISEGIDVREDDMYTALNLLQSLDPAGIGARTVQECLSLQLNRMRGRDAEEASAILLATEIVEKYLSVLAAHDYSDLMEDLDVEEEEIRAAMDIITSLNPHPINKPDTAVFSENTNIYPDFLVEIENENVIVSIPNSQIDALSIGREAQELVKTTKDKKAKVFLSQKMDDARQLLEAIRMREHTLMETMRVIATIQRAYLLSGDRSDLKPMILKDIADPIGMDVSTISRATSNKYAQTPFGIIHLKDLFNQNFTDQEGRELSTHEVQMTLLDILSAEDKQAPLNDSQIQEILKTKGVSIARRTVAKYRDNLGIPVAELRREL